jgi:hypothetical protein
MTRNVSVARRRARAAAALGAVARHAHDAAGRRRGEAPDSRCGTSGSRRRAVRPPPPPRWGVTRAGRRRTAKPARRCRRGVRHARRPVGEAADRPPRARRSSGGRIESAERALARAAPRWRRWGRAGYDGQACECALEGVHGSVVGLRGELTGSRGRPALPGMCPDSPQGAEAPKLVPPLRPIRRERADSALLARQYMAAGGGRKAGVTPPAPVSYDQIRRAQPSVAFFTP